MFKNKKTSYGPSCRRVEPRATAEQNINFT